LFPEHTHKKQDQQGMVAFNERHTHTTKKHMATAMLSMKDLPTALQEVNI
jgi:hypothetical protein